MIAVDKQNLLKSFFQQTQSISIFFYPLIIGLLLISLLFANDFVVVLSILGTFVLLPMIWAAFYFPKIWFYLIALTGISFLKTSGEGLSVLDVASAILYIGGLFIWFFHVLFVKRDRIVKNIADYLILFFFILGIVSLMISALNGTEILFATREYVVFMITLLYFPARYYFKEKKDIQTLLLFFAFMLVVIDLLQFYGYYKIATENLVYAYQLGRTVRTNQTIFTSGVIFGFTMYFFTSGMKNRLLIAIFTGLTVGAIISTFSRTFWVIVILALIILFFYLSFKKKIEFTALTSAITLFVLGLAFLFMKDNTLLLIGTITDRFTSTGDGLADVSVQSRLYEYAATLVKVEEQPLGGNGFGTPFTFYEPIAGKTTTTAVNHNGYIHIAYRLGIPLFFVYFFFLTYYLMKGFWLTLKLNDPFYKALVISSFLSLMLILIASATTAIIVQRDGLFVVFFSIFAISVSEDHWKKTKAELPAKDDTLV